MNVLFNFTTQVEFTANTVQRGFIVHEKESSTDRTKASDHKEKKHTTKFKTAAHPQRFCVHVLLGQSSLGNK